MKEKRREVLDYLKDVFIQYENAENELKASNQQLTASEQQLKASNQQLIEQTQELSRMATVVTDSNDAILIQDLEGNISAWNTGATKMYGYSEKEAIKKNVADLVPEEYKAEALEFIIQLQKGELVESLETKRQTKDGKILDVWMVVTKLVDKDGKLIGAATTGRDITERLSAEQAGKQEEEKLKASNQQLQASEQQLKAANQQLDASNQQLTASEQQLKASNQQLLERVKELNCFYGISKIVEIPDISLEEIFQRTVELIPAAWQYPEITVCRIILDGIEYKTPDFRKTKWRQCSDIIVDGNHAGDIEVYYLVKKPDFDEGPFLKEERLVLDTIAERLGRITERKQAEEMLKIGEKQIRFQAELLRNAPVIAAFHDNDLNTVWANKAYEKATGLSLAK